MSVEGAYIFIAPKRIIGSFRVMAYCPCLLVIISTCASLYQKLNNFLTLEAKLNNSLTLR
jgi:hypothetical protein